MPNGENARVSMLNPPLRVSESIASKDIKSLERKLCPRTVIISYPLDGLKAYIVDWNETID